MRKLHSAVFAAALVLASGPLVAPGAARAQIAVGVSVGIAPPPLPIYDQPPIPGPGYLWTPGYWAWGGYDYYWTPGVWVVAPEPGLLWTPAYWGWDGGAYLFHVGYWGPVVGFYGGINYGFGYPGFGYGGGYWNHDRFFYNRSVNNFGNARIANAYSRPLNDPRGFSRVSYNGGVGGTSARANAAQIAAARQGHVGPTAMQQRHQQAAAGSPALHSAANHGSPAVAATTHAGVLHGPGVRSAAGAAAGAGRIATASHGAGREGAVTRTVNHGGAQARVSPSHVSNAASHGGHARTQTANYARGGHEAGRASSASNRAAHPAPAAHYAERGGGGGAHYAAAAPRGAPPRQEGGGGRGGGGGGHEGGGHPGGGHEGGGKPR